jgi:hypothetical protein
MLPSLARKAMGCGSACRSTPAVTGCSRYGYLQLVEEQQPCQPRVRQCKSCTNTTEVSADYAELGIVVRRHPGEPLEFVSPASAEDSNAARDGSSRRASLKPPPGWCYRARQAKQVIRGRHIDGDGFSRICRQSDVSRQLFDGLQKQKKTGNRNTLPNSGRYVC